MRGETREPHDIHLRQSYSFGSVAVAGIMDYLRMDGKRGHVTCGNRLAIERQESFQKFASLEEELLLPSALACWDPTRFRMG